jgi:type IV secretion system protein VirB10
MSSAATPDDGLPLVGEPQGNRTLWLGLGGIGLTGLLLFAVLESNRQSDALPDVAPPDDYAVAAAPGPTLVIPANPGQYPVGVGQVDDGHDQLSRTSGTSPRLPPVRLNLMPSDGRVRTLPQSPQPEYNPQPTVAPTIINPGSAAPVIVFDMAAATSAVGSGGETIPQSARIAPATAAAAVDRSNLVAQGTLIYAVLETALNSTQAGQARAMISSDVYNASGTKVLIPKGSRVFGEYKGDISAGQNRAQIVWGRLVRPDGVTISLDSPASDQLGRAGVQGKVDTHFGERLVNALLQSAIDFGSIAASRAVTTNNGVVVALPTTVQGAGSQIVQPPPKPTLKVRHGTRIAVFVSRDLDFSAVE